METPWGSNVMHTYNVTLETNQPMNTSFNSAPMNLNQMEGYAIQCVWTGTPTGSLKLQCSVDPNIGNIFPTNWIDLTGTTVSVTAAGSFMWNVTGAMYNWVRFNYTDLSSGVSTAIMTISNFNGKG